DDVWPYAPRGLDIQLADADGASIEPAFGETPGSASSALVLMTTVPAMKSCSARRLSFESMVKTSATNQPRGSIMLNQNTPLIYASPLASAVDETRPASTTYTW